MLIKCYVNPSNCLNWVDGTSAVKLKRRNRILLGEMSQVMFRRGSRSLFCKSNLNDDQYIECDVLKDKLLLTLPTAKSEGRCIPSGKKDEIIKKLCPLMPETRRAFWNGLLVNGDARDLIEHME